MRDDALAEEEIVAISSPGTPIVTPFPNTYTTLTDYPVCILLVFASSMFVDFFDHSPHISPTDYPSPSPTPSHRVANAVVHVDPLGSSGLGERVRSQYRDHESVAKAVTQSVLGNRPTQSTQSTRIIHHPHEPSFQSIHNLHDPFPFYIPHPHASPLYIPASIYMIIFHSTYIIRSIYSSIYP